MLRPEELAEKSFGQLLELAGLKSLTSLPCGAEIELTSSRKKAPGLFIGLHLIIQFSDQREGKDAKPNEKAELIAYAYDVAERISTLINPVAGTYRLEVNGPGLVMRKHFHLHIIIPTAYDFLLYSVVRDSGEFIQQAQAIFSHLSAGTVPQEIHEGVAKKIEK